MTTDHYIKIDNQGRLIYVDEVHQRFTYLQDPRDGSIKFTTLEEVMEYLENKIKFPRWTKYERTGLAISL